MLAGFASAAEIMTTYAANMDSDMCVEHCMVPWQQYYLHLSRGTGKG